MCTMTWFVNDTGYELFFNRDEANTRSRAKLPSLQFIDEIEYISPTDTDAGGTWIAANNYGVTVCLLNHYQFEQIATYKDWRTRGEVVRMFADTVNLISAEHRFNQLDLADYRAFRMFLIDIRGNNRLFVWDGHESRIERDVSTPKSSSAVSAKEVKTVRKELFVESGVAAANSTAEFLKYHASHIPAKSQASVCMHRTDANTVSLSHVKVDQDSVSFAYADGPPCQAELGHVAKIAIAERAGHEKLGYTVGSVAAGS